jgi:hypothetical protein
MVYCALKVKDLEYGDRLNYLRNRDNLPDRVIFADQEKIIEFLLGKNTIPVSGFIEGKKYETLFLLI